MNRPYFTQSSGSCAAFVRGDLLIYFKLYLPVSFVWARKHRLILQRKVALKAAVPGGVLRQNPAPGFVLSLSKDGAGSYFAFGRKNTA